MKNQITVTLPSIDEVEFQIICHEETIPVKGNCIASGDDVFDRKIENKILRKLENGDTWAWCTIEVKANWKELHASDYLGGCSYQNEKDFTSQGGYYDDMKQRAYDELISEIESLKD